MSDFQKWYKVLLGIGAVLLLADVYFFPDSYLLGIIAITLFLGGLVFQQLRLHPDPRDKWVIGISIIAFGVGLILALVLGA